MAMSGKSTLSAPRGRCDERAVTAHTPLWPEGKRFAFSVFDDTDDATLENVRLVYSFLADCGFRTTKSAWIVTGDPNRGKFPGQTCEDPDYLQWLLELQSRGFEIGWHGATWHGLPREGILSALDKFAELFGHDPATAANHSPGESIYWGDCRLTNWNARLYNLVTCRRNYRKYRGHVEGDEYFWGDLCRKRIKYFRNFVYRDINTLKACPLMPYHDPLRPYVNYWYASSDGSDGSRYNRCVSEAVQDRLEEEGGACIMYTHFARDFADGGRLQPRFKELMERLAGKNGWFAPVGVLLDHLLDRNGHRQITGAERRRLELRWLWEKFFIGTT